MDREERRKKLSEYDYIFKNERDHYNQKEISSRQDFGLEKEQFFKLVNLKFKRILGNVKGKKILDVGCGNGSLSFFLAQNEADVIGIDLSSNFIEFCQVEAKKLGLIVDFKVMNAQIPDFKENFFDIIVGSRVIHHLPNIDLFLRECKRLLKKNGYIVFIEPLRKNLIVQLNRKFFAPKQRTRHEHPLLFKDIISAKEVFGNIEHYEFFLLSPLAMFFRNFIKNNTLFIKAYKFLNLIEKPLYRINFFKPYCWQTVFKCINK